MSTIKLSLIRIDGGTQSRVAISDDVVSEYAEKMASDIGMPPIVLFHDGSHYWLADGFHRFMAAKSLGHNSIESEVHAGTKRDAILFAVGANSEHGLPRSNADKRNAVAMLLNDVRDPCATGNHVCGENNRCWSAWSDREIARRCGVHHVFVGDRRRSISLVTVTSEKTPTPKTYKNKHGSISTMRTENIGRRAETAQTNSTNQDQPIVSRGVGLGYAHKAISFLNQIPADDGLRDEALDIVVRWIKDNR